MHFSGTRKSITLAPAHRSIRNSLRQLVSGSASELEINAIVRFAFAFASQRLRQLLNSKRLHLHSFSISTEGIAFDCIAELFQRDDDGIFVELVDYFSGSRDPEKLDEEEVGQQMRILVFSKVNQGLFRLYRENDPVLARIIRNIKLAVKANSTYESLDLLGQSFIHRCSREERNDHLPEYPLEELESEVIARINPGSRIPSQLDTVFDILSEQAQYRRFYSIIDIAVVLKRASARLEVVGENIQNIDDELLQTEVTKVLTGSLEFMKTKLHSKYVLAGKMTDNTFEKYWLALEKMAHNIFVLNDGSELSHPELLAKYIEGLDTTTYRLVHRTHFEYMARVVKNHLKSQMRELL